MGYLTSWTVASVFKGLSSSRKSHGYNTYVWLQWPAWWCWYRSRPDTQLLFMMQWLAQVDGPRPQTNLTPNPQIYSPDQSCFYVFWGKSIRSVPASIKKGRSSFRASPYSKQMANRNTDLKALLRINSWNQVSQTHLQDFLKMKNCSSDVITLWRKLEDLKNRH